MSTPTATPYPSRLWLYFQETHGMVLTASEESDIRHAANAAAESDIRTLETELAASQSLCSRRDDLLLKAQTELAAAQQEAAHYMSVAQKATDELARLRDDNLTAHQMACAAGLERDRLRAEVERLKGALALGQENCDAIYNDMREERTELTARAERAEAELDGIRALADRRNKRPHVEDTTHQLVAALDQALEIGQAELARLRAEVERLTKQNRDEESWWKEKHDYQARAERAEAEVERLKDNAFHAAMKP